MKEWEDAVSPESFTPLWQVRPACVFSLEVYSQVIILNLEPHIDTSLDIYILMYDSEAARYSL